jgi:hypothetical protein
MKRKSIRTYVDIPAHLYCRLEECAAAKDVSVSELVLTGIRTVLAEGQRPRPREVRFPLIVSQGPKVNVTNEEIYGHIEFP